VRLVVQHHIMAEVCEGLESHSNGAAIWVEGTEDLVHYDLVDSHLLIFQRDLEYGRSILHLDLNIVLRGVRVPNYRHLYRQTVSLYVC
jgi:hypothetical protein